MTMETMKSQTESMRHEVSPKGLAFLLVYDYLLYLNCKYNKIDVLITNN